MKKIMFYLSFLLLIVSAGCAKDIPPGNYDTSEAGKVKKVASGIVISMRAITFHSKNTEQNSSGGPGAEYIEGNHGYEYVIRLNNGEIVSIAQADILKFKPNQHVLVIYGNTTRVMPDDSSDS